MDKHPKNHVEKNQVLTSTSNIQGFPPKIYKLMMNKIIQKMTGQNLKDCVWKTETYKPAQKLVVEARNFYY